jgi:hypothetical protein
MMMMPRKINQVVLMCVVSLSCDCVSAAPCRDLPRPAATCRDLPRLAVRRRLKIRDLKKTIFSFKDLAPAKKNLL